MMTHAMQYQRCYAAISHEGYKIRWVFNSTQIKFKGTTTVDSLVKYATSHIG